MPLEPTPIGTSEYGPEWYDPTNRVLPCTEQQVVSDNLHIGGEASGTLYMEGALKADITRYAHMCTAWKHDMCVACGRHSTLHHPRTDSLPSSSRQKGAVSVERQTIEKTKRTGRQFFTLQLLARLFYAARSK